MLKSSSKPELNSSDMGYLIQAIGKGEQILRCKSTDYVKGNYFHFYNRAVDGEDLFRERDDYLFLLKKFKGALQVTPGTVFAYCLMPNHFHFLIRQR